MPHARENNGKSRFLTFGQNEGKIKRENFKMSHTLPSRGRLKRNNSTEGGPEAMRAATPSVGFGAKGTFRMVRGVVF